MDFLINTNNTAALTELKTIFGLETLQDIRDFALTIAASHLYSQVKLSLNPRIVI
jgi:hypothetical protein